MILSMRTTLLSEHWAKDWFRYGGRTFDAMKHTTERTGRAKKRGA